MLEIGLKTRFAFQRKQDDSVDEQNKLIEALIAQQNNDFEVQNRRTKQLINTVRNNIKSEW